MHERRSSGGGVQSADQSRTKTRETELIQGREEFVGATERDVKITKEKHKKGKKIDSKLARNFFK